MKRNLFLTLFLSLATTVCAETIWTGEKSFSTSWGDFEPIAKEGFAAAEVGDRLVFTVKDVAMEGWPQIQLNNSGWTLLLGAGNTILSATTTSVEYVLTSLMLHELKNGGLILSGAGYTLTAVDINAGTSAAELGNAVWIGESPIDWSAGVSKWATIDASCFACAKAGDVIRLNCKDVQGGAQGGILKSDWNLMPGTEYVSIAGDCYEFTITADMLAAMKDKGMIVSGIGYTLASIDIYANVAISEAGLATLCLPFNAAVPEGVSVYTLGSPEGTNVKATKVASCSVIPAGEGVIVSGTVGQTYTFLATSDDPSALGTNTLTGVVRGATAGDNDYAFTTASGKPVFAKIKDGTAIPSRKAYYSAGIAEVAAQLTITLADGTTTAIDAVNAAGRQNAVAMYGIGGERVGANHKGLVIANGRKFINK